MFYLMTVLVVVLCVIWVLLSIKIVEPDQMAVKVILSKPKKVNKNGIAFVPFLPRLNYLVKYPLKSFSLDYQKREVIASSGNYEGADYGAQKIWVDVSAYIEFPREKGDEAEHPLIEVYRSAVPTEEEELKSWTEQDVISSVRSVFGRHVWKEGVDNMEKLNGEVTEIYASPEGPMNSVGFRAEGVKIVVTRIILSEELMKSLEEPERRRLEADASINVARTRAKSNMGGIIAGISQATGDTEEEVRQKIQENGLEEVIKLNRELILKQMSLDKGALREYTFNGASGGLDLVALLGDALQGRGNPSSSDTSSKNKEASRAADARLAKMEKK